VVASWAKIQPRGVSCDFPGERADFTRTEIFHAVAQLVDSHQGIDNILSHLAQVVERIMSGVAFGRRYCLCRFSG
jgi:hypothetical protein